MSDARPSATPPPERQSRTPTIPGEDDWSKLRAAAAGFYRSPTPYWKIDAEEASIIVDYVPRLIDAYAELWEISQALLASVEQWKAQGSGGQLLVADGGEVRQFGK